MLPTEIEAALATAVSIDEVVDVLGVAARRSFDTWAIFAVRGQFAEACDAAGESVARDRLFALRIPLGPWNVFSRAALRRGPTLTLNPDDDVEAQLRAILAVPPTRTAVVIPFAVRRRAVALVYGAQSKPDIEARSQLIELSRAAARRLEEIVVRDRTSPTDDLVANERRRAPRAPVQLEASLATPSQLYAGVTDDVSTGGAFIATYGALRIDDELDVELRLPSSLVHARGRVRWKRRTGEHAPPGVGVGFVDLGESEFRAIERLCSADAGRSKDG